MEAICQTLEASAARATKVAKKIVLAVYGCATHVRKGLEMQLFSLVNLHFMRAVWREYYNCGYSNRANGNFSRLVGGQIWVDIGSLDLGRTPNKKKLRQPGAAGGGADGEYAPSEVATQ